MDKATSIFAALDAGKLPSTQQINQLIDWLDTTGITSLQPSAQDHLSSQGRLLAARVREVLHAYKQLGLNKNGDNTFQNAIWHLSVRDHPHTGPAGPTDIDRDRASADVDALLAGLRTLLVTLWNSLSSESTSLLNDFASFTRLSLADAAELVEAGAGSAKESLRDIEHGVQQGTRTQWTGRSKERVEAEEEDTKVAWEHGMDAVKGTGDTVIDASRSVTASARDKAQRTSGRVHDAFLKICDRAQSDPSYRTSITTIFDILQSRTTQALDTAADTAPSSADNEHPPSLASFIDDPTPQHHAAKALSCAQTLLERLAGTSLTPLLTAARTCLAAIGRDEDLRTWFSDFFALARRSLTEPGHVRSEEAKQARKDLRGRWRTLLEKEDGWRAAVEELKAEIKKLEDGVKADKDLKALREAHERLGRDLENGLVEAGSETVETGLEALMERATWFWQDLLKVYIPRLVGMLGDLPIPRTEYKDSEIEFVLENLDISKLNLLPSHVYIRNITDVDITAAAASSPPSHSRTAIGTLTHIKIEAVQLSLNDVSFWYKDLNASALSPAAELTGRLALTLPPQGLALDLQVRLIPHTVAGPGSRAAQGHFHVVEHARVRISEDVHMEVRESNHGVLLSVFKPVFVMRMREALERALEGQVRALVEGADALAWDVGRRREVFEDSGVGGGAAVLAAVWSEVGRWKREKGEGPAVGWRATGTGVVVEQKKTEAEGGNASLAMGAEPQILSGEKRGPLGTASESLGKRAGAVVSDVTGVDVDVGAGDVGDTANQVKDQAKGLVKEGKKQVESFRSSVQTKKEQEERTEGWRSEAFDLTL